MAIKPSLPCLLSIQIVLCLSACQSEPLVKVSQANLAASPAMPIASSSLPALAIPTALPLASSTPIASSNPAASGNTQINLPDGTIMDVSLPNRFLDAKGQNVQISVKLLNVQGQELSLKDLKLIFSSSRPQDFSIDQQGLVTALVDAGFSEITVQIAGSDLSSRLLISVQANSILPSTSHSDTATVPDPLEKVNVNVDFEGLGLGEFMVNTYATFVQYQSSVAIDADGDFVVVWTDTADYDLDGRDGSGHGVYGQRFNRMGIQQGPEFRVNTYTNDHQDSPAVAIHANGQFVVTWQSKGQDGDGYGVYGKVYDADGVPLGSEFQVAESTTGNQQDATLEIAPDGHFVVAWASPDTHESGVYLRHFDSGGNAMGSEFQVNQFTGNDQKEPAMAMDADGDFVIVWQSLYQDGDNHGVIARRYTSTGSALGSEFQVNPVGAGSQRYSDVGMDSDGDFVVAWSGFGPDGYDVFARRYNSSGMAVSSEFQVNQYTTSNQFRTRVAMAADGDFMVAWESYNQDGLGVTNDYGVYGRRYNPAGVAQGSEFRVTTYTPGYQSQVEIAVNAEGQFLLSWSGAEPFVDGNAILAKILGSDGRVQ